MDDIEDEFIKSWDKMEEHFRQAVFDHELDVPIIYKTIKGLRQLGFDNKFRAGQSLWNFCISRSRKWGLREEQPKIKLCPGKNLWNSEGGVVRVICHLRGVATSDFTTHNPIESPEFMNLLAELEKEPID